MFFQSDTRPRGHGRKIGLSSHHELDTLVAESCQYYCSVRSTWTSSNRQGTQAPHFECSLGALIVTLVRLSLHYLGSFAIPRLPHLNTSAVLHLHLAKTNPSKATMTPGSIGTCSMDIGPVGEHTEKKTNDLASILICLWCIIYLYSLRAIRCKEASLG